MKRFKKMNEIFYNPPLSPLRMRGLSGIHFFESACFSNDYYLFREKSANKYRYSPLWRGAGVGKLLIYLFADFSRFITLKRFRYALINNRGI